MKHRTFAMASAIAIPLILLLTTLLLAWQFDEMKGLTERVRHSYDARAHVQQALSLHQDLETGQRGYVLTGNPAFLEPYEAARRNIASSLASLEQELAGERQLAHHLEELSRLSVAKLAFTGQVVRLQQSGRGAEAERLVATGRGQAIMDAIRHQIGLIDGVERRHLIESLGHADASRDKTLLITFGLQVLLLGLLAAAAWITLRATRARRRDLERLRDLTARQEAIFDAASDAMITHDPGGFIEALNPAAAQLYGYRPEDLIGRNIDILFDQRPERGAIEAELARMADSGSRVQQFDGRRRDGSRITVDVSTSAVPLADGLHFLAVIRDVTERRRVDQMKTEFVSTVSHELRTPLTSIAGSLGLLAGGAAGELPERAAKLIRIAHSNSERLVRLINDILDIEKIESGKMRFDVKPVQLRPLVEQAMQANRAFADGFGVRLELAPGGENAVVLADSDRLMQVVTNLLSNAAKFSPAGETVLVSIMQMGDVHRLTVEDRGPGIAEEFRSRIFTRFAQADASNTRQKGGTGLGLSIVKDIVTGLGGSVSFETQTCRGTAFHVDLPAAAAAAPSPARERASAARVVSDEMPCILHVEDDPDMLRVVASAFEGTADLKSVTDIEGAREALRARPYDVVILDLELPGGDGLDLLPEMRFDGGKPIPVVVFTADDSPRSLPEQVQATLIKSRTSLDELVRTVDSIVRRNEGGAR